MPFQYDGHFCLGLIVSIQPCVYDTFSCLVVSIQLDVYDTPSGSIITKQIRMQCEYTRDGCLRG